MASIRHLFDGVFFDWYQGTLRCGGISEDGAELTGDANSFARDLIMAFKGRGIPDLKECPPQVPQYSYGMEFSLNGQRVAHLCYGGNGGGLHFISSGSNAHLFYTWLRSSPYFGAYSITRADVRADLVDHSAWEFARKIGIKTAKRNKVITETAGDWLEGKNGRTLYIGSRSSYSRVRIYEKGIKEKADVNWVRVEAQIRPPKYTDKVGAAALSADDLLGVCNWVSELFTELFNEKGIKQKAVKMGNVWSLDKQGLDYKARSLVKQYKKTLEALSQSLGGWDMVGCYLGAQIEDLELSGMPTSGFGDNEKYERDIEELKRKVS
jgi:DNA relaxase NicK